MWPFKKKFDRFMFVDDRIKPQVKALVEEIETSLEQELFEAEERSRLNVEYNAQRFFNPEQWAIWLRYKINQEKEKSGHKKKAKTVK
ncbi:MAG: hypothetical protein HQK87_06960 [Nitrospinae bacterium]|nr:hypothetical protein [Nitrospinota bacterium]